MNSISKRSAVKILKRNGYRLENVGKHERWTDGEHTIVLPTAPSSDLWGFMAHQIQRIDNGHAPPKGRREH